jgi:hypothetical protein
MERSATSESTLSFFIKRILMVAGVASAVSSPVWASAPESMAPDAWRTFVTHHPAPEEGCFHASYPSTAWEKVDCQEVQTNVHPKHISRAGGPEVAGSGDYVALTTNKIAWASGGFGVSGITSEVGVAEYDVDGVPQGVLGSDQYSVQLNTNEWGDESGTPCKDHNGCHVWQQFVYANNYPDATSGGKVFMEYWMLDWGAEACPTGWKTDYGETAAKNSCFKNTKLLSVPNVPITDLGHVGLYGSASATDGDSVSFVYGNDAWGLNGPDSVLDISTVWDKAEFNVVGNEGGAQAQFNPGTTITVTLIVADGTGTAPKCVKNDGTTGESNNLSVGPCTASDPFFPNITYTESN